MTSYEFAVLETVDPTIAVVEIAGEIHLTNAPELESRLEDAAAGRRGLVVELNRVSFIDSAALHVFFRTARRLTRERFGVVLDPAAAVARTLTIVGLPDVVTLRGSIEEACADLAP
ncbi:MAG: STAS domain-containing protein [Gaiellaceae bacterium]